MMKALLIMALPLLLIGAADAKRVTYVLPEEVAITLPAGDGVDLVEAQCAACHSLDYIQTQPRGKGPQFWKDAVTKMTNVYGAAIEPADAERISSYLAKTYG